MGRCSGIVGDDDSMRGNRVFGFAEPALFIYFIYFFTIPNKMTQIRNNRLILHLSFLVCFIPPFLGTHKADFIGMMALVESGSDIKNASEVDV